MAIRKIPQGANQERLNFSHRLQEALKEAHYAPDSPTQLAREFNLRHKSRPVTIHAARKWLVGEAIPTQEKIRFLSDWLRVSAEWLRFGDAEKSNPNAANTVPSFRELNQAELDIMDNLMHLDEEQQDLVLKMVLNLVKANKTTRAAPAKGRPTK